MQSLDGAAEATAGRLRHGEFLELILPHELNAHNEQEVLKGEAWDMLC
jgi:hypothetical protein